MPYGLVPSAVRDLITENSWLAPKQLKKVRESLSIDKIDNYYKLSAKRESDTNYFSKSDIECLTDALNKDGELSFDELYNLTHSEKCYYETNHNDKIDYTLLIDEDNPMREEILESMEESSQYTGLIMPFAAGNAYLLKCYFTRPHPKEKYAICVCEEKPLFFFVSSIRENDSMVFLN